MATKTAVILTALPVEFEAVAANLESLNEEEYKETIYKCGEFGGWKVVCTLPLGAGNLKAAQSLERVVERLALLTFWCR